MILDILPSRSDSAAGNMAVDFLLLQHYPAESHARFRHYGWHRPAVTLGFSQKITDVRRQVQFAVETTEAAPAHERIELCRRPTGGGIVKHWDDWTYALVIPRAHPLCALRAVESYQAVHLALAAALRELGCPAELERPSDGTNGASPEAASGVCFQRAEPFDVVHERSRAKIAGAAQKRNKRGLLLQGSVSRVAAEALDWDAWPDRFTAHLGRALEADPVPCGWALVDEEVDALTEQYAAPEWLERR